MTRTRSIDVLEFVRRQLTLVKGSAVRVDRVDILDITTRADAIAIQFDLAMSAP
jgi:hypothetical protein